ncbi:D-beta-hydroxybutyrate dehydrogenase [Candidatus Rhodobacter oscarellae]|uniref:D-beta-hydroxybutyrate dehydrogenase n=1 Tax=Candidatus Rhodobacter oscarellae TaxID=1675527 RepID=A0A0J9E7A1_9RHOB|nr:D-beta-hydroxybutyrate dehydrogenase [Candidatus Rhodobacter lobularis]
MGLGDMGSGLAKNLMVAGFEVAGFDLSSERMAAFTGAGGVGCGAAAQVGQGAKAVFVMVMNGDQARQVIADLATVMAAGSAVILTATIHAHEAREIAASLEGTGIDMIDSPVSGGQPGAMGGTLALMASGTDAAMAAQRDVLEAVSKVIHHVGQEVGDGQAMKACLQSLIGSLFAATYELSVLAGKAGISGQVLREVIASTGAGNGITDGSLENIMHRRFDGTGSGIGTMWKDLTISLEMAKREGVPMHTTATAMQIFQAGIAKYPAGDNQSAARVIEEIVGAELAP